MCDQFLLNALASSINDQVTPPSVLLAALNLPVFAKATTVFPFAATAVHKLLVAGPTGNFKNFAILLS
jgi:hypothetical protein